MLREKRFYNKIFLLTLRYLNNSTVVNDRLYKRVLKEQ